jgi:hypothetical protein
MANNNAPSIDRKLLNEQMDSLAREIVVLKPDDPRRAEIVKEPELDACDRPLRTEWMDRDTRETK